VGCWEEIRYDPSKAPISPTQSQSPKKREEPEVDPTPTVPEQPVAEEVSIEPEETEPSFSIVEDPQGSAPDPPAPKDDLAWLDAPAEVEAPAEVIPDEASGEKQIETEAEPTPAASSRTTIAVWQMSSKWSLAAAYFAKGLGADRYGDLLEQAKYAAELMNIELPDFSELSDDARRQAAIASLLIEGAGSRLAESVAENNSEYHAALADLAIKTHALLLVYTPLNEDLDAIITTIRASAEKSALPAEIWLPLVELLEQRESFKDVKQAVFQLHERTAAHLSSSVAE